MSDNGTHNDLINTFNCTKCSCTFDLFLKEKTLIIACPECGKIHSKTNSKVYDKLTNDWKNKRGFHLKLHSKGNFNNLELTVVGISLKSDAYENWKEYVLLDNLGSIHFISECKGHYHYLKMIDEKSDEHKELSNSIKNSKNILKFNNKEFDLFSTYHASTDSIVGEFNFDVINTKEVKYTDYICPPELISIEKEGNNYTFFKGRYLKRKEVQSIFPTQYINYPEFGTVGIAQPFLSGIDRILINKFATLFLLVYVVLLMIYNSINSEYLVTSVLNFSNYADKEVVSKSFNLPNKMGSYYLKLRGNSYLNNEWIENQLVLVNENTGEEREISFGLEHYFGVDDGYSWSEGSNSDEIGISDVEPGKYHLKSKIFSSSPENQTSFDLKVYVSSPSMWNFWLLVAIIGGIIVIFNLAYNNFEAKREGLYES